MIRTEKLGKYYCQGSRQIAALDGIDLHIASGDFVAVTGASGSGKSTLLNLLGCLDRPDQGSYQLGGRDVAQLADHELSMIRNREIGFVFQSFNLVPHLNILENVEIPLFYSGMSRRQRQQICLEMIERVGLSDRIDHAPSELSGGECQRVAIARAVSTAPAIMLADEPTGNLDRQTSDEIMSLFTDMRHSGTTLVVVTHDAYIAEHADRIIHLEQGHVVTPSG